MYKINKNKQFKALNLSLLIIAYYSAKPLYKTTLDQDLIAKL